MKTSTKLGNVHIRLTLTRDEAQRLRAAISSARGQHENRYIEGKCERMTEPDYLLIQQLIAAIPQD